MTALSVSGLVVERRGGRILNGLSLAVRQTESVALVGPNGAGKTTLLRCWLGLIRPQQGQVTVGGDDPLQLLPRERARRLAWLPQEPTLEEGLSVEQTVAVARYRFRETHQASLEAARQALHRVGAAALASRLLGTLSGGERQRVALAALLAQDAGAVLLDEPANHLDPAQRSAVYKRLGMLGQNGVTVVVVTHDVNLLAHWENAESIRVVGIDKGRVQFDVAWGSSDLGSCLGELYRTTMVTLGEGRSRLIVPQPGSCIDQVPLP